MRTHAAITPLLVIALSLATVTWATSCARYQTPARTTSSVNPNEIPLNLPGVHNLRPLGNSMISGSVPEGDAGFDSLKSLGVRTIISVDGASPDVTRAAARGMRYVHIPITYAEASQDQQLELARAVRDLPGPIFIHCHHGKHRSPTAVASVAVLLGQATPAECVAYMQSAGTAPTYTGLYACVAQASIASTAALDAAPAEFPAVRVPQGITAAMVDADLAFEHLKAIADAGFRVPKDHPDLVPVAEAGRLVDLLRTSGEDPKVRPWGEPYQDKNMSAVRAATTLEELLAQVSDAGPTPAQSTSLAAAWIAVSKSCKDCHITYRDRTTPGR